MKEPSAKLNEVINTFSQNPSVSLKALNICRNISISRMKTKLDVLIWVPKEISLFRNHIFNNLNYLQGSINKLHFLLKVNF